LVNVNGALLEMTRNGLYCRAGDFYIDPSRAVGRAVITHAHSDHARRGSKSYITTTEGAALLRQRVGKHACIETLRYGESVRLNGVHLSLHPAGHILGSAQVRVEQRDEVWVVSGDYKTERDSTCAPFEPVRCHTFLTESTFALPVFRWRPQAEVFAEINAWWRHNQSLGRASVLFAYALGKAQRLLAGIDASIGPVVVAREVEGYIECYRAAGIELLKPCANADAAPLVIAPPSAAGTAWLSRFGELSTAFASGWMQLRGAAQRHGVGRGFVLSDHCDWGGLIDTIRATGAENVGVSHGYADVLVSWLAKRGWNAWTTHQPRRATGQLELFDRASARPS
jgi:putative mRNA 3-end processing factor